MTKGTFKWVTPMDWLLNYVAGVSRKQYARVMARLADALDDDTIQELFQDEMSADGYFEPIDK